MSRRREAAVSSHRRIVVKVGSALLVDGATGKLNAGVACLACRRHRRARGEGRDRCWSSPPARSRSAAARSA